MFKYSFVDLDKTIYDCARLEKEIKSALLRQGVSDEDYGATYRRSLCTVSPAEYDYNFEEHLKFLREAGYNLDEERVSVELYQTFAKNFLFLDSVDFLKFLKKVSEKVVLLTAGDADFQSKKIANCGLEDWFDEVVIVSGHKERYLSQKYRPGDKVLFVNDSLRENLVIKKFFPDFIIVGRLTPGRYQEEELARSGIPYFKTLTEIKDYVSGLK